MKYEVYDKAKWHYEAEVMPKELSNIAGATHIAFFVRWCIENDFISKEAQEDLGDELEQIKKGELDCREFFFNDMDGVFSSEELNAKGNKFAAAYYHSGKTKFAKVHGFYLQNYSDWVKNKMGDKYNSDTSYYYIEYSEENYNEIKVLCDKRYSEFLKQTSKRNIECPVCSGIISFVENDVDGSFYGCGECGSIWRKQENLMKDIAEVKKGKSLEYKSFERD